MVANQKDLKKPKRKPGSCRFCGKSFTRKAHAMRHEETAHKQVAMIELMPGQTNSLIIGNIDKYDCKYCDKKFTLKGSSKRHEKKCHTKEGYIQEPHESLQHNNASSKIMDMDVPKFDRSQFISESEENSLSSSFQSFVTNYQLEIQQESLVKKEFIQMNDQICESSRNEEKDKSNVDSSFQNDILGQLSILEPIPLEDLKENSISSIDVQNDILGQLSKLEPDMFEKSTEINKKSTADEKPFGCEYCDKRFKFYLIARHHEKIHTGEKPFACNICNFKSTRSSSLTKHVKSHGITNDLSSTQEAVKPKIHEKEVRTPYQTNTPMDSKDPKYACKYCDKTFAQKPSVIRHERIHTGEKPYGCQYCEKKFTQSQTAKAHERSHTAEKPYACKYCDKKFTQSQTLKKHELTHKQENMELNPING